MVNGTCTSFFLVLFFSSFSFFLPFYPSFQCNRRDKILYKPCRIERFVIVIFDHPRYFTVEDGKEMAEQFCLGAASVGIQVMDKNPLIFSKNPQQNIGGVSFFLISCFLRCLLLSLLILFIYFIRLGVEGSGLRDFPS